MINLELNYLNMLILGKLKKKSFILALNFGKIENYMLILVRTTVYFK